MEKEIKTARSACPDGAKKFIENITKRLNLKVSNIQLDIEPIVMAEINQGRWIANCPDPHCSGAELVDPLEPIFYCFSCANKNVDGRVLRVKFPNWHKTLEEELLKRDDAANMNWKPKETLKNIRDENEAHGIGG